MKSNTKTLILPALLITIGVGWLLSTLGVAPGIDWVWILGLSAAGLMAFVLSGIDKVSVVIGPFFILASFLSILRQTNRLPFDVEVPILVISSGVLLLIARSPAVTAPDWLVKEIGNVENSD
ncbi:MAG: hypothetical protein R3C18_05160 [Planctomycetaceae bacterium]